MDREQVTGSKLGVTAVVMTAALMAMIDITIVALTAPVAIHIHHIISFPLC